MRGLRRVPLPLIVAVLVTVAVTGCSDGHPKDPSVGSVRTTAPETGFLSQQVIGRDEQMLDEGLTVTWLNEDEIAVTTWGSGSCPLLPLRLIGTDLDQLILDTGVPDDTPCTADMSATTTTIERPVAWPVGTELRLSTVDGEQVLEPVDRAADRLGG